MMHIKTLRPGLLTLTIMLVIGLSGCHQPPPGAAGNRKITSNVKDWRDQVIYQVMVDRFADGDYSNNYNVDLTHMGRYHGGDWRGLIDHIDYFKALGVTTLWISPVVKNVEEDAGFASYHGYWTQDFMRVNPHFGDLAMLQEMVDAMHAAGINVILDIVTNHIGQLFYYDMNMNGTPDEVFIGGGGTSYGSHNSDNPSDLTRFTEWDPDYDSRGVQAFTSLGEAGPAPIIWVYSPAINRIPPMPEVFQNPDWYHKMGRVTVWENKPSLGTAPCETAPDNNIELCDYVREQEVFGDFPGGLKDLATELPQVQDALIKVFQYWIEVGDFDGFRIDTLKHVDHGFWKAFCKAVRNRAKAIGKEKFFMFGEAFTGADRLLAEYTQEDEVDSVFYFSQKYRIDGVFKYGAPTKDIENLHKDREKFYGKKPHVNGVDVPPADVLVNFMDNHDVARFLHENASVAALHNALFYLFTTVGIPCIYYGTEQQFRGGNDPANREDMWLGNRNTGFKPYDTTNETFKHIKTLIELRKKYAPLRRGDMVIKWATSRTDNELDAGILAYERTYEGETILIVMNTKDCTETKTYSETSFDGSLMQTSFIEGNTLTNVFPDEDANDEVEVGTNGMVDIRVPCRGGKIFILKP